MRPRHGAESGASRHRAAKIPRHIAITFTRHALPMGLVSVQNIYHLLERNDEDLLTLCREHGIAWMPYFPLGSDYTGKPRVTENRVVCAIAEERNATLNQVGLAWQLKHSSNTIVISGTGNRAHLEENLGAGSLSLSAEETSRLDQAADGRLGDATD